MISLRTALFLALLLAAGPLAPPLGSPMLGAQTVRVRVTEEGTGSAVVGAIVALVDSAGRRVAQALSGADGRVVLRTPTTGLHRLRGDRIGFAGAGSEPFRLDTASDIALALVLPVTRIGLPDIVVTGRSRCETSRARSVEASAIWEEARKVLAFNTLGRSRAEAPVTVARWRTGLEMSGRVRREERDTVRRASDRPFFAESVVNLREDGWIQRRGGAEWFYGPDADLLLDEAFLLDHCVRAVRGEGENNGLVGLAFQPLPDRRAPDIEGVLWVDRATAELRHVEFTYVRPPRWAEAPGAGGRLEFGRLATGRWIVRKWWIRMPVLVVERSPLGPGRTLSRTDRYTQTGWTVQGAEVLPRP